MRLGPKADVQPPEWLGHCTCACSCLCRQATAHAESHPTLVEPLSSSGVNKQTILDSDVEGTFDSRSLDSDVEGTFDSRLLDSDVEGTFDSRLLDFGNTFRKQPIDFIKENTHEILTTNTWKSRNYSC